MPLVFAAIASVKVPSTGTFISISRCCQARRPAPRATSARHTAPSTRNPCGPAITTTSTPAAFARRPNSSIASRVFIPPSASSLRSGMIGNPWGTIAPKTSGIFSSVQSLVVRR